MLNLSLLFFSSVFLTNGAVSALTVRSVCPDPTFTCASVNKVKATFTGGGRLDGQDVLQCLYTDSSSLGCNYATGKPDSENECVLALDGPNSDSTCVGSLGQAPPGTCPFLNVLHAPLDSDLGQVSSNTPKFTECHYLDPTLDQPNAVCHYGSDNQLGQAVSGACPFLSNIGAPLLLPVKLDADDGLICTYANAPTIPCNYFPNGTLSSGPLQSCAFSLGDLGLCPQLNSIGGSLDQEMTTKPYGLTQIECHFQDNICIYDPTTLDLILSASFGHGCPNTTRKP
ncbi:hypothetical protein C8R46DRAFT_1212711 [Mycena filopes]|nr:hypothetical protein C8R46DRAFT_1212711 [Mycena filopes]